MATHEFKFVVSDADLTPEQIERVSSAVAQAGTLAVAELTPSDAITFRVGPSWVWRGIPPVTVRQALQDHAANLDA
jgi:hypothetical protein